MAFLQAEPQGEEREDLRLSVFCQYMLRAAGGKPADGTEPPPLPSTIWPYFEDATEKGEVTDTEAEIYHETMRALGKSNDIHSKSQRRISAHPAAQ